MSDSHLEEAERRLGVANHLLTRTYPLVNDSRMLLAVAKELHLVNTLATNAFLETELATKRIPVLPKNPEIRIELLEESVQRHSLGEDILKNVKDLHEVIVTHEKSPVEFAKPDKFVICDKDYKLITVTVDILKSALSTTRTFVESVNKIVSEDERIPVQRKV